MSDDCCDCGENAMILSCSGGSNVGQLTNRAAIELTQEGFGKMFCLAGIGGNLSGFVRSARDTEGLIVLDGCEIGCAKAIMDNHGISMKTYAVLTDDLGIKKNKDFNLKDSEIQKAKEFVKNSFGSS